MEQLKDLLGVFRGDADAVVFDLIEAVAVLLAAPNANPARSVGLAIFDGVFDQIGEHLLDERCISGAGRQRPFDGDIAAAPLALTPAPPNAAK